MSTRGRALVHPLVDGWLLGGLGVVAWLVVSPIGFGRTLGPVSGALSWMFLGVTAAHFGSSYHLAYGSGLSAVRRNPVALGVVPLALALASVGVVVAQATGADATARSALRALFVVVFSLTGWHYIKQAYGVALITGRAHGIKPQKREALLLRYSLYPVWLASVFEIYGRGSQAYYRNVVLALNIFPAGVGTALNVIAVAGLVLAALVMVRIAHRAHTVPPLGMWGAYAAGGLWLLLPPTYVSGVVMVAGLHAIQYLTCVHRAEVDWAVERGERQIPVLWISIFGGAAAGGLLLSTWLPALLDRSVTTTGAPGMYASLVFVILNLHHYAIDASIWRSGGDHVVRISRGPRVESLATTPMAPTPAPALA